MSLATKETAARRAENSARTLFASMSATSTITDTAEAVCRHVYRGSAAGEGGGSDCSAGGNCIDGSARGGEKVPAAALPAIALAASRATEGDSLCSTDNGDDGATLVTPGTAAGEAGERGPPSPIAASSTGDSRGPVGAAAAAGTAAPPGGIAGAGGTDRDAVGESLAAATSGADGLPKTALAAAAAAAAAGGTTGAATISRAAGDADTMTGVCGGSGGGVVPASRSLPPASGGVPRTIGTVTVSTRSDFLNLADTWSLSTVQ